MPLLTLGAGDTLNGVLSGAVTSANPNVQVQTDGNTKWTALTAATAVILAAGKCEVNAISCVNTDTAAVTLTLSHVVDSVSYSLAAVTLQVGYKLVMDEYGVRVIDTAGQVTSSSSLALGSAQAFTNTVTTTDGVPSGTARRMGGVASRSIVASTAQLGTVETRTVFDTSFTMPANTLKAGTVLRIRALVFHTATTGSETHTLAVAFDSTDLAVTGNLDPADNGASIIDFTVVCRTAGALGTVVGWGTCTNGARAAALTATHGLMTGTTSTSTQAVDTTAAIVIGIAIDRQGTATDTDSCRLDALTVEIVG